jgi:hypothetical protein
MAYGKVYHELRTPVTVDGTESANTAAIGYNLTPTTVNLGTLDTRVAVYSGIVPDGHGGVTVWEENHNGIAAFTIGLIVSTHDVWLELGNDQAEFVRQFVPAGLPVYFSGRVGGSNTEEAFNAAAWTDGVEFSNVIKLNIFRNAGGTAGDASVDVTLF